MENNLTPLFTKCFLALLTSKDAVLKGIQDCILQNVEKRCRHVITYLHSYFRDLHVRSACLCMYLCVCGCVCVCVFVEESVAIPKSIQEAVLE